MELKDINITVDDPNKEYWIGNSSFSSSYKWDNFFTDGRVKIIKDEGIDGDQENLVKVDKATYVAIETIAVSHKEDGTKESNRIYKLIGNDPAKTIEELGIDNIFSDENSKHEALSTSCIYSKMESPDSLDPSFLPRSWMK